MVYTIWDWEGDIQTILIDIDDDQQLEARIQERLTPKCIEMLHDTPFFAKPVEEVDLEVGYEVRQMTAEEWLEEHATWCRSHIEDLMSQKGCIEQKLLRFAKGLEQKGYSEARMIFNLFRRQVNE